jgi:LCP family protein required for cell wall assembly
LGNFILKMRLESWISRFFGRPEEKYTWQGRSMARPMTVRRDWGNVYNPPLVKRRVTSTFRRAGRRHMNAVTLLGVAFGLVLCIIIAVCLAIIGQTIFGQGASPAAANSMPAKPAVVWPTAIPGKPVKILLLGSDQRPNDPGYRTDVIMLMQIDPAAQTVSVVSFPRDLWVEIPAKHDAMKINMVQEYGGFDAVAQMLQDNFGVRPDYYVLTNFSGFTTLIDSQGGVDVQVASDLTDECSLPQRVDGNCSVKAGTVHMDGATALWYVRSRHSSSDFDRLRRAQEVLFAVAKKMMDLGTLTRLPELKAMLDANVQTNLTIDQALSFMPVALAVLQEPARIKRFAIGEEQTTESISWNGMWILLQNPGAIPELLKEAGIK